MRKLALVLMLAGIALPTFAAKKVGVEQLQQMLAADHGKPDGKVARQLAGLELTDRLDVPALLRWQIELPGAESRRSLVMLADMSAFLDPPAAEMLAAVSPDLATQRRIMALAVDYAKKTISELPNFFAARDTILFEDSPEGYRQSLVDRTLIPYQPLHAVGRSSATILYRGGREVVDSGTAKQKGFGEAAPGLTTSGVFGTILGTVLVDAAQGKLVWSHWENGPAGPQAVFGYEVPREKSHYKVEFCCLLGGGGLQVFQQLSGYHGVIAVDPLNGSILRLTLQADLTPSDPIVRSDISVVYGPVEIGGRTYICPLRSVSITLAPALPSNTFELQLYRGELLDKNNQTPSQHAHMQTLLNDVAFGQYHVFRADTRVLTGNSAKRQVNPPVSSPADTNSGPLIAARSPADAAPAETGSPVAPAPTAAQPTQAPEPAVPETSVAGATDLPDISAAPLRASQEKNFTLSVTTRLVNVGVVALNRKGHPVTDLKAEDFEIYDNGRKQVLRSFSQTGRLSPEEFAKAPEHPDRPPEQPAFSNRLAGIAGAEPEAESKEASVTILLIDADNLAWSDLSYARAEMLKSLRALPAGQRVGLYVMKARSFQVLEEGTADRALLESRLEEWMPSAQDLARAQEMEQRNRQQFDDVHNPSDLQYVNGNVASSPETPAPVDPQLRDDGSDSGRGALALPILAAVAEHLAAIPGHKSLVWITSDNTLANWSDKAIPSDKGARNIDGLVLRVQEALNDAQVSVYPVDASRLQTMTVDPSLENRNIELSPGVTALPPPHGGGAQPGRITAEMEQDTRPIQGPMRDMAAATGGRALGRSGNIAKELEGAAADGQAAYLLGFTPDEPADGQYHQLVVKLTTRRGITLRYRTGYQYAREPDTLKQRFRQAIWQPLDESAIAVRASSLAAATGAELKINIAANDLALKQQGNRWVDKLDIFVVQREEEGVHARITGQTLSLALQTVTYEKVLQEGIPFDQLVETKQGYRVRAGCSGG